MASSIIIKSGKRVNLKKYDPASTDDCPSRDKADAATTRSAARIGELQDLLYANGRRSLLVVLQGLDAAGKDGTVRRVFDNVNPTGVVVTSFKTPTALELRHDFMWRCHQAAPPRGVIGIFNRSHYEEVLVVRVHSEKLLPPELQDDKKLWMTRFQLINEFEQLLALNGTQVLKFFLHISREEQRQRLMERQKDPKKNWKLAAADFEERQYWDDYQMAYEEMIQATSTKAAPWHIIPADRKWVRNYWVARTVVKALEGMNLQLPRLQDESLLRRRFK